MVTIYLKYGNYTGSSLNYSAPTSFVATKMYERYIRRVNTFETLRGKKLLNKFNVRKYYNITISANELTNSAKLTFMYNFFQADAWQISFDGSNYTNVIFDDEELDITYIEEIKDLPEVTLKIYNVEPE